MGAKSEIKRIALDTSVGMVFSNVIAFFIILTTAAVLHASGVTNIRSAAEAAEALRPSEPHAMFWNPLFDGASPALCW